MSSAKQTKTQKAEKLNQEREGYLMSLIDGAILKRFTIKRAEKLARIVLWGDESLFKKLVSASKSGIAYADRFIAIADFMAAAGYKSTNDLWGKSEYDYNRDFLHVIDGLTALSLNPVAQNARAIVYNQEFSPVAKAYKYNRKAKELWVTFGDDGMLDSVSLDSSSVYPDKGCPSFEWLALSDKTKKELIAQLIAGSKVELPKF